MRSSEALALPTEHSARVARNTQLFVRRNWIDLPVRMASGQRAILSFEKGASGNQILNDAFNQWQ